MKSAFDKIAAGLEDAIAYANGDTSRGVIYQAVDVKAIRQKTKLSQPDFAHRFGVPVGTVRDWEQRRRLPDAPARTLLKLIDADPEWVARKLAS